jgi:accessory colonization factor AcfC
MKRFIVATSVGIVFWSSMAVAADVKVLSAGAVEPGLLRAAEQFERASGNEIKVQFNTAPQLPRTADSTLFQNGAHHFRSITSCTHSREKPGSS